LRIVLDTNVLVSIALAHGGRFDAIWRSWREERFHVLACTELLVEVDAVLARPKLARHVGPDTRRDLVRDLTTLTYTVELEEPWPAFEDPDDRFLLALAREGSADALVTGDAALQALVQFGDTVILSPADFMRALEPE
jgi:putative PIN family toxin of toxin-antitoxin system